MVIQEDNDLRKIGSAPNNEDDIEYEESDDDDVPLPGNFSRSIFYYDDQELDYEPEEIDMADFNISFLIDDSLDVSDNEELSEEEIQANEEINNVHPDLEQTPNVAVNQPEVNQPDSEEQSDNDDNFEASSSLSLTEGLTTMEDSDTEDVSFPLLDEIIVFNNSRNTGDVNSQILRISTENQRNIQYATVPGAHISFIQEDEIADPITNNEGEANNLRIDRPLRPVTCDQLTAADFEFNIEQNLIFYATRPYQPFNGQLEFLFLTELENEYKE